MTTYYLYCVDPIDTGWHLLHVLDGDLPVPIAQAAKTIHWDGDIRGHHIGWLPMPYETGFLPCFVWKQDNNGDTFVASPIAIKFPGSTFDSTTVDVLPDALNVGGSF